MADAEPAAGLLLSRDLFFTSKIEGTAAALGYRVEVEDNRERALCRMGQEPFRCIFFDLTFPGFAVADVRSVLPAESTTPIVAFGPHVDTARLDEARVAQCAEVLPRSRFSSELPALLDRYLGGDRGP
ncbi:MAG TPA: hypothetical protein VHB77_01655 [Planctomycetaceae bacterium]|nr:hypothetical protein [Planctomycetaceae bacterium]